MEKQNLPENQHILVTIPEVKPDHDAAESSELITDKGLDLFYDSTDSGRFLDLSQSSTSWESGREGLEGSGISKGILHQPSIDLQVIATRQEMFQTLLDKEDERSEIENGAYSPSELDYALEALDIIDDDEKRGGHGKRRKLLFKMVDEGLTEANLEEKYEEARRRCRQRDNFSRGQDPIYKGIDQLRVVGTFKKDVEAYIVSIRKMNHPILFNIAEQLDQCLKNIPEMSIQKWLDLHVDEEENKDEISVFKRKVKKLNEEGNKFSTLLWFVNYIEKHDCASATFDGSKPRSYTQSWNCLKERDGSTWDKDKPKQVRNDSPADNPLTILCGSNMSGKTFYMLQDMYVQMWAQTFGFVPASEGNFPELYDSFVYVDRASTDSDNNLSAFGKEIDLWKQALEKCGEKTYLCADEAFSTTSPEDQYKLARAMIMYLQGQGVRVTMANHNESLLQQYVNNRDTGMYYFETSEKDGGDIDFLHKLTEGIDDSKGLEVAKRMGLPKEILAYAEQFLRGDLSQEVLQHIITPELEVYSAEEREQMKLESKSFRNLNPGRNELITPEDGHVPRTRNLFSLHELQKMVKKGHLKQGMLPDSTYMEIMDKEDEIKFFQLLSEDRDFRNIKLSKSKNSRDFLSFLQSVNTSDSKELYERQNLFGLLIDPEVSKRLTDANTLAWASFRGRYWVGPGSMKSVNTNLLDRSYKAINFSYSEESDDFHIYLEVADMNCELEGKSWSELGMEEERSVLKKLADIYKKSVDVFQNRHSYGSDEYKKEEKKRDKKERKCLAEAHELLGVSKGSFSKLMKEQFEAFHTTIKDQFTDLDVTTQNLEATMPHIQKLTDKVLKYYKDKSSVDNDAFHILKTWNHYMNNLLYEDFVQELRGLDSVHTHQWANYMEKVLDAYFMGAKTGRDYLELSCRANEEVDNISLEERVNGRSSLKDQMHHGCTHNTYEALEYDIQYVWKLLNQTEILRQEGFCKVDFNSTGEVKVEDGWSLAEKKDEQKLNGDTFTPEKRTNIITGTNMSGKTFYMKSQIFAQLCAHSLGYAPAKSMTTPIFDQIMYLDRVNSNLDENLSAFGNEITLWKKFFESLKSGDRVYAAVDEAFSTTSETCQGALTYGVTKHMNQEGHNLTIASHNHGYIEGYESRHPKTSSTHHFKTHVDESGDIVFDYEKEQGHESSQALAVAKKLGLPQDILDLAKHL